MVSVWRLAPPAFARILDGEGSRQSGGRWNSPGRAMVYTSSHLSLCVLELYVHIPPELRDELPELEAVRISIPDNADRTELPLERLKELLEERNSLQACQAEGDNWLARDSALVLQAPSVLVPEEANFMINPSHPQMQYVRIVSTRRFRFDPRLTGRRS
jgi:RES domain-containing protein